MVGEMDNATGGDQTGSFEPYLGLEFNSADDAREFYISYAKLVGFKVRIGQLYRSRTDGSVASRRFVCSKEGFQTNSRTGCPAFIRVQIRDSGKWVIDHFVKDHNHDLELTGETCPPILQPKAPVVLKSFTDASHRPRLKFLEEDKDELSCPSSIINVKRLKKEVVEGQFKDEPCVGLEFNTANEAHRFYHAYAANSGFSIRIGQLFRSKSDGSITSRRFVCSKEGFQHPSRIGCGAYLRIKRQECGNWVVDRLMKDHNHDLSSEMEDPTNSFPTSKILTEEVNGGAVNDNSFNVENYNFSKRGRENHVTSDWYSMLSDYFQCRQAEDTGFFHAVEVDDGHCMSIFWADGRSRYSCSQFGDVIVLDTSYRKSISLVPFATFVGVNHHKQPVLLGSALIADESEESFTWLFRAWLRAMSGRQPLSIIADQDMAIQQAIAKIFPGTHHRFSLWQINAKEQENLFMMDTGFKYEFEKCIYHSQTADEFDTIWNALLNRYKLKENAWLKEMYEKRACWVPFFLRGSFFAGIPVNENIDSFFDKRTSRRTVYKALYTHHLQNISKGTSAVLQLSWI
ncbi:Protein FAR1-RELATED SEQUENCE like [Quillaja saponaria]|uniref:Protein FAR1-RELATED SEQUENCE n=1 Tax=Quillaja saponaria TaxID=32244 RepID=A0AAD7VLL6_QUISA|nr:Protein FAR1-RELATED SEQUENCE like [Quillaja saponaria]